MSRRKPRDITPRQLLKIWLQYAEFRKPALAYSTYHIDYAKITVIIAEKMPLDLSTAVQIRDWVVKHYETETTRRIIMQFNACCNWAYASDLHPSNPFVGMTTQFRRVTNAVDNYKAFTAEERDAIILRFTELHSYYTPWVKFLFWTGCRPSEAAALKWQHIRPDLSELHFKVSRRPDTKKVQTTKNRRDRWFRIGKRLKPLIQFQKPTPLDLALPVFPGVEGGPMEYKNFQSRHWEPTVKELVEERKVFEYMSQYHARHTFITLQLEAGKSVTDVANMTGNTPRVIWDHYASKSRNVEPAEI